MSAAREVLTKLLYQLRAPRVTTMGPCSTPGCNYAARGGATCAFCLERQLAAMIGAVAYEIVDTQKAAQTALFAVEDAIEAEERGASPVV